MNCLLRLRGRFYPGPTVNWANSPHVIGPLEMCEFDKPDKAFAADLYLVYKYSLSARVCISDRILSQHCSTINIVTTC